MVACYVRGLYIIIIWDIESTRTFFPSNNAVRKRYVHWYIRKFRAYIHRQDGVSIARIQLIVIRDEDMFVYPE